MMLDDIIYNNLYLSFSTNTQAESEKFFIISLHKTKLSSRDLFFAHRSFFLSLICLPAYRVISANGDFKFRNTRNPSALKNGKAKQQVSVCMSVSVYANWRKKRYTNVHTNKFFSHIFVFTFSTNFDLCTWIRYLVSWFSNFQNFFEHTFDIFNLFFPIKFFQLSFFILIEGLRHWQWFISGLFWTTIR